MIAVRDPQISRLIIAEGTIPDAVRFWASRTPAAPALTDAETTLTYGELAEAVEGAAGALEQRGVSCGDRVILIGENSWRWVVAYLAILSSGAIVVPANIRLSKAQLAEQAEFVDAALVLVDERYAPLADGLARRVEQLDRPGSFLDERPARRARSRIQPGEPALISFTSGTTGNPKGALLSHAALAEGSRVFARVLGTSSADSTVVLVPMFHNTGFVDQLGHMLLVGGETILLRSFRTQSAVEELARRQVTFVTAVPSIIRLIMTHASADQALGSARILLYGGSPMPEAWSGELAERWPALRLFHGYGLTEFTSAVSFLPPEQAVRRESVGSAAPGVEVRIVDADGAECAPGETGELIARGPTMMSAYWGAPELTALKIVDGWLHTGDLAHWDGGRLYLDGRVDDVINRGGEKVLPAYVESKINEIPGIADACVFGLDDPILQSRVHAVVRLRDSGPAPTEEEVRSRLALQLPDYAIPETVQIWADLPRGASGKVDRRAVVEQRKAERERR